MPDTNERHDELPSITLGEVFTDEQISLARTLFKNASEKSFSHGSLINDLTELVVKPNLPRINEVTGQENDPRYWAYCLYYGLVRLRRSE